MQSYTVKILWYILTIWVTMEYKYKLFKRYSSVNAYKNSFIKPYTRHLEHIARHGSTVVQASNVNTFRSRLDSIDLRKHCIF